MYVHLLYSQAMNYRHDVFSAAQKLELEAWVRSSKVLKVIFEEKERARTVGSNMPSSVDPSCRAQVI